MNSRIKIITKFSILFLGMLMPLLVYGQGGPGPPPPPAGIPLDVISGLLLGGAALLAGKKYYLENEAA
ncbi:MAG: hypothetical protein SH857_09165 [Chitinophagales bacterium]|nr:hypothetical protein [Chitinophagales bacterium]